MLLLLQSKPGVRWVVPNWHVHILMTPCEFEETVVFINADTSYLSPARATGQCAKLIKASRRSWSLIAAGCQPMTFTTDSSTPNGITQPLKSYDVPLNVALQMETIYMLPLLNDVQSQS